MLQETQRQIESSLYKLVIESPIYSPIHKGGGALALALHYLILLASHRMTDSLQLLLPSAKSAFVSLGTLRTFELITLSTFGC